MSGTKAQPFGAARRLKNTVIVGLIFTLEAIVPACSSPTAPTAASVAGTWDVTLTEIAGARFPAGFVFTAVATFFQSGIFVSGTFRTTAGLSGTVTGSSLAGSGFTFRVDQEDPCRGTFNSNASIQSSQEMSGSYFGSDCNGMI